MELLEYQAKELFKMVDIPILPSQTIKDSRTIKQLQIPYPVVLKSQVRSGGRGKAGGIKFVANTIDAIAAARTIFNLSILGEYPQVILAEAHYNTEREFFLAIVLDYDLQCPVLLGSACGGMNVNSLLANLQQVVIDDEFSLFYARRLAASMGLSGQLICSVSEIIAKMYRLFQEKDLDLIEINPLGVNKNGELMALDGKITINDHALGRQPIIATLNFPQDQVKNALDRPNWHWLDWQNKSGKIAVVCSSFDLALLSWDLLNQNRLSPACGITIDHNFVDLESRSQFYRDSLQQILAELESIEGLKAVLINIWESEAINGEIIETIADYIRATQESNLLSQQEETDYNSDRSQTLPKFILRILKGENFSNLKIEENMYLSSSLEDSIDKAIAVVKSS
ncbi:acetate--CoA ligase family protein [Waterburya agarophytonicola K14]|uniref:Acetate--CoA ligase family protein n=1 Tax=Waterburya agarophytonicola KI4 TaxID=2874699 RepID=A0A964BMI1_9CYAN|nr:ATP-grasp domain-containing protein [Waterburya agarophytonicola]MCC0175371.1 acetate--CoA ligase family protein [Waterburya agarophytonicola KI4]